MFRDSSEAYLKVKRLEEICRSSSSKLEAQIQVATEFGDAFKEILPSCRTYIDIKRES